MTDYQLNATSKPIQAKPLLFKASANEAVNGYAKLNPWLRTLDSESKVERDTRREKVGKTASKWLDQLLETKYDVMA